MHIALLASLVYLLLPGHPDVPGGGLPLRIPEIVLLAVVVTLFVWSRSAAGARPVSWTPVLVIAVAAALKSALAFAWYPTGWLAEYYANETLQPPLERSTDYLPGAIGSRAAATRIDRRLEFRDTQFPVHFFNDDRFAHGSRREVTDPFSVRWSGRFYAFDKLELTFVLDARGAANLAVDGREVVALDSPRVDGSARGDVKVSAGDHAIEVRYRKPANTEAFLRLSRSEAGIARVFDDPLVLPFAPTRWQHTVAGLLPAAAWMGHGAAFLALLAWLGPVVTKRADDVLALARRAGPSALDQIVIPALSLGLIAIGTVKAWPLGDRVWTLEAGHDLFALEAQARSVLVHGVRAAGSAIGGEKPFLVTVGYGYFLAAVHRVSGESLAGVVLVHFLLLAGASSLVYLVARALIGSTTARAAPSAGG